MTTPRVVIFVQSGCATVEAADGPVDVAIVDFDMGGSFDEGVLTEIEGAEATADIVEMRPSPHECPGPHGKTFDQLWAEAVEAADWRSRDED